MSDSISDDLFAPLGDAERPGTDEIARPSKSYWKDAWIRFRRDRLAMAGLVLLIAIFAVAAFYPMVSSYEYDGQDFEVQNQGPSFAHWCGTDKFGRDILVRLCYGARISLTVGLTAALVNMLFGVMYGGVSGYFGGRVDMVMMRIVDILIGLPSLLYIILIMMFLGNTIQAILLALCLTYWINMARMVRTQVLSLKNQEYALAAKVLGASDLKIIVRHLIPNSMGLIIVTVTFLIPQAIFSEAFLSFLGIGIQVPMASWGTLVNEAIPTIFTQPHQMLFPALAISLTIFSFNFVGDGLRDALDPRLKR